MQFFRLLHRQTKSEGDVATLLCQPGPAGVTAPVFVPLQGSLPSFDPTHELYASPTDSAQGPMFPNLKDEPNTTIVALKTQLVHFQEEHSTLEQDLADYRADLFNTRTELYSEMLRCARHQQRAMDDFRTIQKLEARHQRFYALLVDIGIPRSTVDVICQVIQSGNGSPEDILVDAIRGASENDSTLLARLKPIVKDERTPEHYQSALNLTLSTRKELRSQKKKSKFWKKLAQENDRHASTITPSPSDISSIRQDISPERQRAVDVLVARRRGVRYPENAELGDVFGCERRESALDTLVSSLASRPRRSIQDDLRLSSSFSSSASSISTHLSYISAISRIPKDSTMETPTIPSRLPSTLSTSLRRSSRSSSQSIVLGNVDLNVSRSSSIDPTLPEEAEQDIETGPASTTTLSQDLLQNDQRASQGHGHRRMPSRRSVPTQSNRSSFRLSAFSPIHAYHPAGPLTETDLGMSGNTVVDAPFFDTPDVALRLSDLTTSADGDTPALNEATRNEDTPFNDARVLPKYDVAPLSLTDLEARVASTPLDDDANESVASESRPLRCAHNTRFLDSSVSMSMSMSASTSASVSASEASVNGDEHEQERGRGLERDNNHSRTDSITGTIPLGESNDSLFSASTSASATSSLTSNDTPAPATPPTPSPSPIPSPNIGATPSTGTGAGGGFTSVKRSMLPILARHLRRLSFSGTPSPERERFMDKLRGLRSLSRATSGSRSSSRSESKSQAGSTPRSRSGSPLSSVGAGVSMWRGSPARSDSSRSECTTANSSPSQSPLKGSGIPVLRQRRTTIRARKASVKKT